MEIPTYPYDKESHKLRDYPLVLKDKLWRSKLHFYIDKVVTYSNDKTIFGINCINITNCVDHSLIDRNIVKKSNNDTINLVAVSSLAYWHGYDRLIKGLIRYHKSNGSRNILLHIVGDGDEFAKYDKLVEEQQAGSYINLYGALHGKELTKVYNKCDIAFDSLGRHRSGVYYNSSLKSKEYLAKGLPVVSSVDSELDDFDIDFHLKVSSNDEMIQIPDIIEFYDRLFINDVARENKISEIRKFSEENFSYSNTIKKILES